MILNHLWGIYAHPKEEWRCIESRHESLKFSLSHILLITLIPAVMSYVSATQLGWSIGVGDRIYMSHAEALIMAVSIYLVLIGGIFAMMYMVHYMAKDYDSDPDYTQSLELAAYTATPLFMSGLAAFYPELWFFSVIAMMALGYSIYLLYVGTPIIMKIPEERGFFYASSVATAGLILLVASMIGAVILWGWAFSPV
ncbi:MAG: DUF1282 domain-containing protein [Alteromonadaceae bacterium]|nr:DUF1282 domain-containing protein [Alteromonadaceae bacterium]